ncbi:MAG: HD domain-containing phosphohydrolase [Beijerinckiaceae bacterium]
MIDADLREIAKADFLRAYLPDRTKTAARIVVVDKDSPASLMQANVLGASDVFSRPLDADALRLCLSRRLSAQAASLPMWRRPTFRSAAAAPGGVSIDAAAAALDQSFGALIRGGAIDSAALDVAGNEIIDAIADIGLANWLSTVRTYHEGTFQHCMLVTGLATSFGHRTGMRRDDVRMLTTAALLHDVGKARIPIEILDKPGQLSQAEFQLIKSHTVIGYEYLLAQNDISPSILSAVRHHHEYLDGSGYPDGLSGAEIDDVTRILTICDIYGALVEERAYKKPKAPAEAIEILMDMARNGKVEASLVQALARA